MKLILWIGFGLIGYMVFVLILAQVMSMSSIHDDDHLPIWRRLFPRKEEV